MFHLQVSGRKRRMNVGREYNDAIGYSAAPSTVDNIANVSRLSLNVKWRNSFGRPLTVCFIISSESYCSPPRVLSCLHVFCENCLNKLFDDCTESCDGEKSIRCTLCNQVTNVSTRLCLTAGDIYILWKTSCHDNVNYTSTVTTNEVFFTGADTGSIITALRLRINEFIRNGSYQFFFVTVH